MNTSSSESETLCRSRTRCSSPGYAGSPHAIGPDGRCSACHFDEQFMALIRELPTDIAYPRSALVSNLVAAIENAGPRLVEDLWNRHGTTSSESFDELAMGIGGLPNERPCQSNETDETGSVFPAVQQ